MIPQYPTLTSKLPKYRLKKKLNTVSAHFPLHAVEEVMKYLGLKHPIIFDVYNL